MKALRLKNLSASDFYDAEDWKGLKRLEAVPGIKNFIAENISTIREKFTTIEMAGDGVNVSEDSYPQLHSLLKDAAETLGLKDIPAFSMTWGYDISIGTEGSKSARITALTGAIDLLDDDELTFLLGHELGHLMAGHKPWHNLLITLYTPLMNMIPNAKVWLSMLRPMLLQWYRTSDFTADRAGLLACQDINVALRTMVKMAGIPRKYYSNINCEAFLKQAMEFARKNQGLADGLMQNLSINTSCAPWMVYRASKLYNWYKSGEYTALINKCAL